MDKIKVKNKEFEAKAIANNYAGLFQRVLRNAPTTGMTIGDMADMADLIKRLTEQKDAAVVELTAAEIKKVKERANNFPWATFSEELVEMDAYLKTLI